MGRWPRTSPRRSIVRLRQRCRHSRACCPVNLYIVSSRTILRFLHNFATTSTRLTFVREIALRYQRNVSVSFRFPSPLSSASCLSYLRKSRLRTESRTDQKNDRRLFCRYHCSCFRSPHVYFLFERRRWIRFPLCAFRESFDGLTSSSLCIVQHDNAKNIYKKNICRRARMCVFVCRSKREREREYVPCFPVGQRMLPIVLGDVLRSGETTRSQSPKSGEKESARRELYS